MIDTIVNSFDIWTDAQGIKSRTRVRSVDNISLEGTISLRKLILDLAIQGKLTIHDPNDEPASKLLARIIEEKNKLIPNRTQTSELKTTANEKPFQLPDEWIWSKLGSLGIAQTGSTPKTTIPEYFNGGEIPFIGPGQINRDGSIMESDKFLTEKGSEFSSTAEHGDIVMVCIGGSIGKSAIVQSKITFNQQLNSIRPLLVQSNYLQTALNSTLFQNSILEKSTGSATPIINRSKWESIAIPLPPIEEQYRIVAKVNELMSLCDKLEAKQFNNLKTHQVLVKTLLETLTQAADANELQEAWERMSAHFDTLFCTEDSIDQLKQTILQLAVMGKLVKQDPNDEPASVLLKKIVKEKERLIEEGKIRKQAILSEIKDNEKLFVLPESWEWCRLGVITEIIAGMSFKSDDFNTNAGTKCIKITNAGVGEFIETNDYLPESFSTKYSDYLIKEGDLILALTRPYISDGLKISNCPTSYNNSLLNQRVAAIRLMTLALSHLYVFCFIQSPHVLNFYKSKFYDKSQQPNMKMSDITDLVFALPPLEEQYRIVSKINELFAVCESLKKKILKSQEIKVLLSKTIVEKAVQ